MYMLWIVWSFLVVCQYRHSLRLQRRSTDVEGIFVARGQIREIFPQERACVNLAAISLWRPFQDSSHRLLDRTPYALSILQYCKVSPGRHCIARTWAKGCVQDLDSSVCVTKDSQHLIIVDSVRLEIREVPLKVPDCGEVHVTRIRRLSGEDTSEVATSTIEEWRESRLISKLTTMCFSICIDQSLNEVLITHPRGVTEKEQRERIIAVSLVDPCSTQVLDTTRLNLGYCIPAIKYSSKTGFIYVLDHENSSLLCTRRVGKELRLLSVRSMYRSKIGEFVLRLSLPEDFDVFTDKEGRECIVVADTDNKRIILWRGDDPVGEDLTGRMRGEPISVEVDTSRRFGAGRGPRAYFGMLPDNTLCELDLDATEATPVERMGGVIPLDIAVDKHSGRMFVADDVTKSIVEVECTEE